MASLTVVLTDTGRANFAALWSGSGAPLSYLGWGTSTTAPSRTDTALGAEVLPRIAATVVATTTSVANDTLSITGTFTATASAAIAEVGVLTAATGGVLVLHAGFSARTVQSGDTIAFGFTIQFP